MNYEDLSQIRVHYRWKNPYTGEEKIDSDYLPRYLIDEILPIWLMHLGITCSAEDFNKLLAELNIDIDNLGYSDSFLKLAEEAYQNTEEFKAETAHHIDDYEFENNLGDYAEDDEYIEGEE